MNKNLLIVLGEWWEQHYSQAHAVAPEASSGGSRRRLRQLARQMLPNISTLLLVGVLIVTANVWAKPLAAPAAPGPSATTVNYQGRLADPAGNPKNGTFGMTFALYDASTGGSLVWGPESHAAVPVSEGLFSVGLGSQTSGGIPTSAWNGDRYLEITVSGETLSPRELIRSVPIAGMALAVPDGAITSAMVQDGTLQLADFTAFAGEARDLTDRSTTSSSFVNFGSTSLAFNLPYQAMVYVYLRGALYNPSANCVLTVAIDGVDTGNIGLYLETVGTSWRTSGTGGVVTLDPGSHTIRPRFSNWASGTTCTAGQVGYGYIVLGRAP